MNKPIPPSITIQPALLKLLLVIATLLVLPHSQHLNPTFIIAGFALLAWRALTLWFPKTLPHKLLLLPLSIGLALLVLKTFGMSLGRDASSSLLIILMGLKLLESRTARDVQAVIYMCFFVLITPFLFDQRIELALYALIIFFLLLFALILNNTRGLTLKTPPLLRLSGLVLLQAIPLMLVFFLLFPRMIGPLWAMPDNNTAISGLTDTINPGQVSNLALSDETAFRVRFKGTPPEQKDLYWRGPVFWETDGQAWTLTPPRKSAFERAKAIPNNANDYQYTLMMEPHNQFWVYALDLPNKAPNRTRLSHDHQLILDNKLSRNLSFDIRSSTHAKITQLSSDDRSRALLLPNNTDKRVISLAQTWVSSSTNHQQVINKALRFYNDEFYYTLKPPSLGTNPVAEFLFDTKRGFCGHFSTSFATLMRAANIPARLVGGYQGGVYNKVGDFYDVRQADAHVWVEVWLDNSGWTRIDPTAAIAPNRIEHSIDVSQNRQNGDVNFLLTPPEGLGKWVQQLNWILHSVDYHWQNAVLAYGPEKQLDFLSTFGIIDWGDMVIWLSIFSGVILFITLSVLFLLHATPKDTVQTAYLKLCKQLAKKAGARNHHETSSDYFKRINTTHLHSTTELNHLKRLYLTARYGKGQSQTFINAVRRFKLKN